MKTFSTWLKYFNLHFSETLNFADFKYVFGFFISFFDQKLQSSEVGPFCLFLPIFDHFKPTLEFKDSEKYKLKYFSQVEKIFIFSSSFFIFTFDLFKKFTALYSSTQNYLFNEVLLLIICFFLQEELTKMCGLPELLE